MANSDQEAIDHYCRLYPTRGTFTQVVSWPTLAPQLVPPGEPDRVHDNSEDGQNRGGDAVPNVGEAPPASQQQLSDAVEESEETAGQLVYVTMLFQEVVSTAPVGRAAKAKSKASSLVKTLRLDMDGIGRCDFIRAWLAPHRMEEKYKPNPARGPPFKLWFQGSSGGKAGAATIETDTEFDLLLKTLLKKTASCIVNVSFDIDEIQGFRCLKRMLAHEDDDPAAADAELGRGNKVPRIEDYDETQQLHGAFIVRLKREWKCEEHREISRDLATRCRPGQLLLPSAVLGPNTGTWAEPHHIILPYHGPCVDRGLNEHRVIMRPPARVIASAPSFARSTSRPLHNPYTSPHVCSNLVGISPRRLAVLTTCPDKECVYNHALFRSPSYPLPYAHAPDDNIPTAISGDSDSKCLRADRTFAFIVHPALAASSSRLPLPSNPL
ncbi:hypothetical protein FIBSPDRAFT_959740 [Athelia psychrophila]|uniref:Uncharacterized protein n=1 Tax=Athelia psychrophila TaxID=1759441 RepID=A0A166D7V8_9AGAM|nr:hypothetical protein FIBSPDRAFT_959740 [Fibularhizoctonia sp. CBS 109695]